MSGIYQSSENGDLIRENGPHRDLVTDKSSLIGGSFQIDVDNFILFDNIVVYGVQSMGQLSIEVSPGMLGTTGKKVRE